MGTMPINRLLLSMAIPIMISMLVQALYNIVDSYFVAKISEDALNAVSLSFPVQNLMIAVGSGTGVGINALLSKSLGEKKQDRANAAAVNGLFLASLNFLVFLLFGLFFSRLFFAVQTDVSSIVEYGHSYLTICCCLSMGLFAQITFERLLQATGRTIYSMVTQLTGAVINIILDPILIFGLFGFPRMEVAGAALATVIGQLAGSTMAVILNTRKNTDIHVSFRGFRPDRRIIATIYGVGLPSIIMMSIGSVMVFGFNKILLAFTTTATAVFGVYYKLQSFVFMPVFGMNNGMVPIVAYNYGARKPARIIRTIQLAVCYATGIMLLGILLFQTMAPQLMGLFQAEGSSGDLVTIGSVALRIISVHFIFAGFSIVCSSVFQALGHGVLSLIVSVVRQLVVLLPAAFILSRLGGLEAVWWAFPIAELSSAVLCAIFLRRVYHREILPMKKDTTNS
jgi:putative MATE family efflux protein